MPNVSYVGRQPIANVEPPIKKSVVTRTHFRPSVSP